MTPSAQNAGFKHAGTVDPGSSWSKRLLEVVLGYFRASTVEWKEPFMTGKLFPTVVVSSLETIASRAFPGTSRRWAK